jgi:acyl-coenzyme A synthetase/AMP-(fatty) acid ligase
MCSRPKRVISGQAIRLDAKQRPSMNIVDPILFQCRQNPPAAAMCAPGTALNVISYSRLERFIHNIGRRALAAGIRPGSIVAIMLKDHIFHAAMALALARLGVATLSVGDLHLPPGLRVDAVIADAGALIANPANLPIIPADLAWTEGDGRPIEDRFVSTGGNDIARIVLTSGSTGVPKPIAVSHALETRRIERLPFVFGPSFSECLRFFCDMGLGQSTCFRMLVYVLWRGGTFFFPGADPMDSLQTFGLYDVQGLVASPGGLSGILKFYEANSAFQTGFRTIVTMGSPLHKSLSERVRARLGRNLLFLYGASETATIALASAHVVAEIPGAVGHIVPGVTLEIVDAEQRTVPQGTEGAVRVRSPTMVDGYLGDPEQTQRSFRDGCFHSGDLGYLIKDGMLVISGREKEVLNLGGVKIRPDMVEGILTAFESIDQAAVFAMPNSLGVDELWALIVPKAPVDDKALRAYCEQRLPLAAWPARVVTVDRLPRNQNGKIERQRLKDMASEPYSTKKT